METSLKSLFHSNARLAAGLELTALFSAWTLTFGYLWPRTGASAWTIAGIAVLQCVFWSSVLIRRPSLKSWGVRFDNLWPAFRSAGAAIIIVLVAFRFVASQFMGVPHDRLPLIEIIRQLSDGIWQQALFSGYLLQRWLVVVQRPWIAVVLNAAVFAFVHLPELQLVTVAGVGGLFLGGLFVKWPNIFLVGIIHGLFVMTVFPSLKAIGFQNRSSIAQPALAAFGDKIQRDWRPGDRVGLGPRYLSRYDFGQKFESAIVRVGFRTKDDKANRERLKDFLTSEGRAFLAISTRDYEQYIDKELTQRLVVLDKRLVWTRESPFGRVFLQKLFGAMGDYPVIGAFRDEILLISNEGPASRAPAT